VKTEAAAGKHSRPTFDRHSDCSRAVTDLVGLFQDERRRPNGKELSSRKKSPDDSPKLWPRITLLWSIADDSSLVKSPYSWDGPHQA